MRIPNLLLKPSAYKTAKLYSILPENGDGDFLAGVSNAGTRVNKDSFIETIGINVPRIDYHNGPGLLLEPTRENLMTNAWDSSQGSAQNGTLTANDTIAPNGIKSGFKFEDSSTSLPGFWSYGSPTISASTTYTFSFFIKFGTSWRSQLNLNTTGGTAASTVNYIYPDGTIEFSSDSQGIMDGAGFEHYGDGWIRFYFTFTSITGNTAVSLSLYPSYGSFEFEPTGYFWLWGNQLEEGAFMTSLIPTVGTTLTRTRDSYSLTDIIADSITSQSATFVVLKVQDLNYATADDIEPLFQIGDPLGGRVALFSDPPRVFYSAEDGTTVTYNLSNTSHNIGWNVDDSGGDIWLDGVKIQERTDLFAYYSGETLIQGHSSSFKVKELAIYNQKVSDTEAKSLTV